MKIFTILFFSFFLSQTAFSQDTTEYHLTIDQEMVNKTGKPVMKMTVNGSIPGPTLRFTEGDYAVIYVENNMDVETSVHWHGLLLPNFYDGVPYLTTPPIKAGTTFKYEFPIKLSGTYWYHSHTMLQEQSGVYGSIVIDPKEKTLNYDDELVVVLSDWTNEKSRNVLRNLKRGLEWYNVKKGTATPLNRVIGRGALGAQLNFWKQRMEGADIADVYYPSFLTNGQQKQVYPEFKPGQKVRVRVINASASSQFWLTFGEDPLLVSADGMDVVPVVHPKTFIAIAETYDFILTIPEEGQVEIRATAQDGSGQTSAFLGSGKKLTAPEVPRPDKIGMMKQMAEMKMKMGAPAMKYNPDKPHPEKMMDKWGMHMDTQMDMDGMKSMESSGKEKDTDHQHMNMSENPSSEKNKQKTDQKRDKGMEDMDSSSEEMMAHHDHQNMDGQAMTDMDSSSMDMHKSSMKGMHMYDEYKYDYLKSPVKTNFSKDKPVKEVLLNLTGNMWRYIWSMNGVPLNESDQIKIKKGQITRITLNNLTMMHHPMHLHGHFFRVINKNGEYSPLKHTVNVPPMEKIVIEFDANEYGDWFFHCHVLYHMNSGMARIFSYDTKRDERLLDHPLVNLVNEANQYFTWGVADVASHMTEVNIVSSNIRNQFNFTGEFGYNKNMEAEVTYERYIYDYFRVFGGINIENEGENSLADISPTAVIGVRYFTPYMFNLDFRVDNKLRPEIRLSREVMIFPRTILFGEYEYQANFGWVEMPQNTENSDPNVNFMSEITWSAGLEYMFSQYFSIMGSYDNRFGAGGGLSVRF